jgi:hypothetical protein
MPNPIINQGSRRNQQASKRHQHLNGQQTIIHWQRLLHLQTASSNIPKSHKSHSESTQHLPPIHPHPHNPQTPQRIPPQTQPQHLPSPPSPPRLPTQTPLYNHHLSAIRIHQIPILQRALQSVTVRDYQRGDEYEGGCCEGTGLSLCECADDDD